MMLFHSAVNSANSVHEAWFHQTEGSTHCTKCTHMLLRINHNPNLTSAVEHRGILDKYEHSELSSSKPYLLLSL